MGEFQYSIIKEFGEISPGKDGWKKELNLISWNNRSAKLDVRDWAPGHEKMGKGITLTTEEAVKLVELLQLALSEKKL